MTSIKHRIQSEILQTVNSKSYLNCIHLAKIMVCYVLRTIYNSVLDIIIILGEAVINTVFRRTPILLRLYTKFVIMPDWPFSVQCFPQFLVIAYLLLYLSERLKTFFMIPEERWENNKILFHRCLVMDRRDAYYVLCL